MIVCRCECKQVFNVEPYLAGTEVECPVCHRVFTVPAESDPDVVLPAAKTAAAAPATAPVPPEESTADDSTPDAAGPPLLDGSASRLRLRKTGWAGTDSGGTEEPEGPTNVSERFTRPPLAAKKKGGLVKGLIRGGVGIVVLALGYKFGFGPLVMKLLDRPSLVVVHNGEAVGYQAILGWRRVTQDLPAGGMPVTFRVFVGMPETQTLTLRPVPGGAGELQQFKVPVRPRHSILVNPGQKTVFWLIDENGTKSRRVDKELGQLVQQVSANDRPTNAEIVVNAVRGVVREAIKGRNSDLFIDLDAYRMDELAGVIPATAAAATEDKLLLTAMPIRRIAFANGGVNVTLAKTENLEGQVELPAFAVSLLPDVTVNVPARQPLQIFSTAKTLRFSMHIPNQVLKVHKGQFPGAWEYTATYKADATPADAWRWQWIFNGEGVLEGEKVHVNATWNMKQMPTVRLDKATGK